MREFDSRNRINQISLDQRKNDQLFHPKGNHLEKGKYFGNQQRIICLYDIMLTENIFLSFDACLIDVIPPYGILYPQSDQTLLSDHILRLEMSLMCVFVRSDVSVSNEQRERDEGMFL